MATANDISMQKKNHTPPKISPLLTLDDFELYTALASSAAFLIQTHQTKY
jgi:hypothetical protein